MTSGNLLKFTCEASILRDAIEATSNKYVVFAPNQNFLVLTNSTAQDDVTSFNILTKEVFKSFQLGDPNQENGPENTIDGSAQEDDEMADSCSVCSWAN